MVDIGIRSSQKVRGAAAEGGGAWRETGTVKGREYAETQSKSMPFESERKLPEK
jgi:hypothetical protein